MKHTESNNATIFSATLGLFHPWRVISVTFAKEEKRLDIDIDVSRGSTFVCAACGAEMETCEIQNETWYHQDFFSYETYLHARVPLVECCCCGVLPAERPWSRAGSKFIQLSPLQ